MARRAKSSAPAQGANKHNIRVRTALARRYRAGLGPFGPEPIAITVTTAQLDKLLADPMLEIEELEHGLLQPE